MGFILLLTAITMMVVLIVRAAIQRTSDAVSEIQNQKDIEEWGPHHSAGLSALDRGDLSRALAHLEESHAIAQANDDFEKDAASRRALVRVHQEIADLSRAEGRIDVAHQHEQLVARYSASPT